MEPTTPTQPNPEEGKPVESLGASQQGGDPTNSMPSTASPIAVNGLQGESASAEPATTPLVSESAETVPPIPPASTPAPVSNVPGGPASPLPPPPPKQPGNMPMVAIAAAVVIIVILLAVAVYAYSNSK